MTKKKGCVSKNGWFPCTTCSMIYNDVLCKQYRKNNEAKVRSEEISDSEVRIVKKFSSMLSPRYREMRP